MKICGVELTGSDAVVCLLNHEQGQFNLPDCRVRKLGLNRAYSRREFQQFQFGFSKLMRDYSVDKVFHQRTYDKREVCRWRRQFLNLRQPFSSSITLMSAC